MKNSNSDGRKKERVLNVIRMKAVVRIPIKVCNNGRGEWI